MYHCTSSAAIESMHATNREMRAKTVVEGSRSIERMHSIDQDGVQTVHKSTEIGMGNGN